MTGFPSFTLIKKLKRECESVNVLTTKESKPGSNMFHRKSKGIGQKCQKDERIRERKGKKSNETRRVLCQAQRRSVNRHILKYLSKKDISVVKPF